jgi:ketosteroid isomerase-like protein
MSHGGDAVQTADPDGPRRRAVMTEEHPNVSLLKQLDLGNLAGAADLFAENFVWHCFNPRLPDVQGDYVGLSGLQTFFEKLGALTEGSFEVEPISVTAVGDELVVMHNKDRMTLQGMSIETDVVVVWRIVGGRFAEVWDIPSVYAPSVYAAQPQNPHAH